MGSALGESPRRVRVLLADDHEAVRTAVRLLLRLSEDLEVVGEASTGAEAVELVQTLFPDVVLMDVSMPVMGGIEATRLLAGLPNRPAVVGFSSLASSSVVQAMLDAGAAGFLSKEHAHGELTTAIRTVATGQQYRCPHSAEPVPGVVAHPRRSEPAP